MLGDDVQWKATTKLSAICVPAMAVPEATHQAVENDVWRNARPRPAVGLPMRD
jgi:hypothetical protein